MSKYEASFLRSNTSRTFQAVFNDILYNRDFTWAMRCFGLSLLSRPVNSKLNLRALKNRLGTSYTSLLRWKGKFLTSPVNKKWKIISRDNYDSGK